MSPVVFRQVKSINPDGQIDCGFNIEIEILTPKKRCPVRFDCFGIGHQGVHGFGRELGAVILQQGYDDIGVAGVHQGGAHRLGNRVTPRHRNGVLPGVPLDDPDEVLILQNRAVLQNGVGDVDDVVGDSWDVSKDAIDTDGDGAAEGYTVFNDTASGASVYVENAQFD